jgi:hypothetical protein
MSAPAAGRPATGTAHQGPGVTARPSQPARRLVRLYLACRRVPAALAVVTGCAVLLRILLHWHWDDYGALQLPLMLETAAATVIASTTTSPFGESERATGRWLPFLRLGTVLALTAVAAGALAAAGTGGHLAGGTLDVLRNVTGLTGIGLLCAAGLGGGPAWTGPLAYLLAGAYNLYAQWHGTALSTPWLWPSRPPGDLGAMACAGAVLAAGTVLITIRGARDPAGE